MREAIGQWAELAGAVLIAMTVLARTVESAAKGNAIAAAIYSPITLICIIAAIYTFALEFGWLSDDA